MNHLEFYITMGSTEQQFIIMYSEIYTPYSGVEDRQGTKDHPYQTCIEMHLIPVVHAQHLEKKRKNPSPCSAREQPLQWKPGLSTRIC